MKLIDKDAVVVEIERKINEINLDTIEDWRYRLQWEHDIEVMKNILSFLDTLEVKDVDLEKEIYDAEKRFGDIDEMGEYRIIIFDDEFHDVLRHFFELGLKAAQKGE